MFSKFRSSTSSITNQNQSHSVFETNPIVQYFEIGKAFASSGPESAWKIHSAFRKSDGKKRIAEKLHKPKRKEIVSEVLRNSIKQLERYRHPRILHVLHTIEECSETLAFASEPLLASLANVLAFQQETLIAETLLAANGGGGGGGGSGSSSLNIHSYSNHKTPYSIEYNFMDIELKYGLLQIIEALSFLHYNGHIIHRNICPSSILINKKGTWKLSGFEFIESLNDNDGIEPVACQPWSSRISKMAQPPLDYIAPEVQITSSCSPLSDMYSLGMLICAIFNHGRPLIQANYSLSTYSKQIETLEAQIELILSKIPIPLHEATVRLLSRDIRQRPTSQLLSLIKYFSDPNVSALQFLDVINMKDPTQKANFYRNTLKDALIHIPRKLWFQHVWLCLQQEMRSQEVLASVLQPVIFLIQNCSTEEYEKHILPSFRHIFATPKSVQALVTILENLHIILEKSPYNEINSEVLPLLYSSFESATIQVQNAALLALSNVSEYINESAAQQIILPKIQKLYANNVGDLKINSSVLLALDKILDKLSKQQTIDIILPFIWSIEILNSEILVRILHIYKKLLSDKKYGLSIPLIATRIMPYLVPETINRTLNLEQFCFLIEVLQEMLDQIDKHQRNKLKLDNLSLGSSSDYQQKSFRHQFSTENINAPAFNIPNLRVERRKTSSAENMARKNSTGGILGSWWFNHSSSSTDSNFLKVLNAFPNRRLSDNSMMTPKIHVPSSCATSPGATPNDSLPLRRHSSIGPRDRRGSAMNLSPPPSVFGYRSLSRKSSSASMPSSNGGSMPNTSVSVPFLVTNSSQSMRSRRTSTCSSQQGSTGFLQQLGSGMVRFSSSSQHLGSKAKNEFTVRKCPSLNIRFTNH